MYKASCHCGAIEIDVAGKPQQLTQCNCSICRRYRALWAYYTQDTVKLQISGKGVSGYIWGDRMLEFFHCNNCGCITHYKMLDDATDSRLAVNAANFPPDLIQNIDIRNFDGVSC